MAKPAYGTLYNSTNAICANMRAAYLLNGSSMTACVNSVGGAESLTYNGSGLTFDTDGVVFGGSGNLQLPNAVRTDIAGIAAATLLIGFKSSSAAVPLLWCGGVSASGDYFPYSDNTVYSAVFLVTRINSISVGGLSFASYRDVAITAASAGGSWKFYVDGSLETTQTTGVGGLNMDAAYIGRNADGTNLTGNIEYFYLWKRILSSTEISTLHADPYGPIFAGGGLLINPGFDGGMMQPQLKGGLNS